MRGSFFKPLDFGVIGLALALIFICAFAVYSGPRFNEQAVIEGSGRTWIFPLDAGERVAVQGPLGDTVVEIRGGEAWVLSSPCTNQTCVSSGRIHGAGSWVACLPNNVFVYIEGNASAEVHLDAKSF
ncbi:MAG: NusG domain II-containing protein [Treponema sp.]|nr:NusG domain II-containing protein [Treponema sp.]